MDNYYKINNTIVMKSKLIVLSILLAVFAMMASCSASRNRSPEQIRQDSIANVVAQKLITDREFVLTANRVSIGSSPIIQVFENSNFILIDGDACAMQLSPRSSAGAFNARGNVSGYTVSKSKNGDVNVRFQFNGKLGSGDVSLTLYSGGTQATAYIDTTFGRGRSTFYGKIEPIKTSVIKLE